MICHSCRAKPRDSCCSLRLQPAAVACHARELHAGRFRQRLAAFAPCDEGVNADDIRKCLEIPRDHGYSGVLCIEREGRGGPMIERSLNWLRTTLRDLNIPIAT